MPTNDPITTAEKIYNEQNGASAIFGGFIGCLFTNTLWTMLDIYNVKQSEAFALVAALIIGFFVLFCGRGLSLRFRLIAVCFTLVSVLYDIALLQEGKLVPFRMLWITAGLCIAFMISERRLNSAQREAVWEANVRHQLPKKRKRNKAFTILALLAIALPISFMLSVAIYLYLPPPALFFKPNPLTQQESRETITQKGLAQGRELGKHLSTTECEEYSQFNNNCLEKQCILKNEYILKGCLEAASKKTMESIQNNDTPQ